MFLSARFSTDSKQILSIDRSGEATTWDSASGRKVRSQQLIFSYCVPAISRERKSVAIASPSPVGITKYDLRVMNPADGSILLELKDQTHLPTALGISPDGELLAWANNEGIIRITRIRANEAIVVIGRHLSSVNCLAFSPDGKRLASGSSDHTIKIWGLEEIFPSAGK